METITPKTYDTYIKALTDISRAITSDLYIGEILKLIVLVTAKVTGMDICSLWLVEEEKKGKILSLAATQAIEHEYVKDRRLSMDEGVVGFVASNKKPMMVKDVMAEPLFKEKDMAKKLNLVSLLSIPLIINEEAIGVLNCFTCEPHEFNDMEVNLIESVANQASVAIQNTRLMVRTRVIEQELATRKKIERAKEILAAKKGLTGEKAFRWIQKKSMDTRKTMKEIAEAVILSDEI